MMFIDVLWIMMFHESLCITLLLFHFVQFLNFSSSISPNPLAAWHGVFKSQVLASDYRSRAGLHALRAKDDTVLLIANVHLQGWGQGWEVEVGSWRHIWQKGVPKVISCSTFLDVASIVTVIWIMNIHESCVWPFQKMKGVFFFFGGGVSRAQWFNEGRKWWKLTFRRRDPLATETRRSQLRSAFRHLDRMQTELQISSDETATIVAGDFNDLAGSSLHQDLQKGLFDKTSRSMVDAYGHLSTAPATFRAAGRADRIDFIYHTKNLETQSLRWPLSPEEEDRLKWSFRWPPWPALIPGDWYPSDHVPIAALFSFKAWFSRA